MHIHAVSSVAVNCGLGRGDHFLSAWHNSAHLKPSNENRGGCCDARRPCCAKTQQTKAQCVLRVGKTEPAVNKKALLHMLLHHPGWCVRATSELTRLGDNNRRMGLLTCVTHVTES